MPGHTSTRRSDINLAQTIMARLVRPNIRLERKEKRQTLEEPSESKSSDRGVCCHRAGSVAPVSTPTTSPPAALITGGTSGIGRATAQVLHENGYSVLVTGRNSQTLATARKELPDEVHILRADVGSLTDTELVAQELKFRFGKVDLVFLNAAQVGHGPIDTVDEKTFDEHFGINRWIRSR